MNEIFLKYNMNLYTFKTCILFGLVILLQEEYILTPKHFSSCEDEVFAMALNKIYFRLPLIYY